MIQVRIQDLDFNKIKEKIFFLIEIKVLFKIFKVMVFLTIKDKIIKIQMMVFDSQI